MHRAVLFCLFLFRSTFALDYKLDESFNPAVSGPLDGLLGISDIAVQSNGQIIIVGSFTMVNGQPRSGAAILNADGSLDEAVNFGGGFDHSAHAVVLDHQGGIIIGGEFSTVAGSPAAGLARFFPNGELDSAFVQNIGVTNPPGAASVWNLTLQPDGQVLVGGFFTYVAGIPLKCIARINPEAAMVDSTFNPRVNNGVFSFSFTDAAVYLSGAFRTVAGFARPSTARLDLSGGIDWTYSPATILDGDIIWTTALQSDGKALLAGSMAVGALIRLNADGSRDGEYKASINSTGDDLATTLLTESDSDLLVGGFFSSVNGASRHNLARLHPDGTLDETFSFSANDMVSKLTFDVGNDLLIAGYFSSVNAQPHPGLFRLKADLTLAKINLRIVRVNNGIITIAFRSEVNTRYELQSKWETADPWTTVKQFMGDGSDQEVSTTITANHSFYRLKRL